MTAHVNDDTNDLLAMLNELETLSDPTPSSEAKPATTDLLDGLDLDLSTEELLSDMDAISAAVDDELVAEAALSEIESAEVIEASPKSDYVVDIEAEKVKAEAAAAKEKKPKVSKPKALSAPREKERPVAARKRFAVGEMTDEQYESVGIFRETFEEALGVAPVKAADKIVNLLAWYFNDVTLSVYTEICLRKICESKQAKVAEMRLAMMSNPSKPYPVSTAGSQAGQMLAVFPALNIAEKQEPGVLVLNEDSPIVAKFKATM
jgi:hypothetical protein